MSEKEIDKYADEMLKSIEEKEEKSLKRLKIFSWVFFFVGLEVLGILMHYSGYIFIKIIALNVYTLIVGHSFYKLGLKEGVNIEQKYHKMDNERNEKIISKLKGVVFKSGE